MKIVIAIDSFKGSLSSLSAGSAVRDGALAVFNDAEVLVSPLADGGEGTVSAIVSAMGGRLSKASVTGPLGETVDAEYGIIDKTKTAIIEMSAAAGITLVEKERRNPLFTTTFGVGELIRHAITENGCRRFVVGIGGSATNDGGVGMLEALGFSFLDKNGNKIAHGAVGLSTLADIVCDKAMPELCECEFYVACDVKNPLCGEFGASAVYGPQKGATPEMVQNMDLWLGGYAAITERVTGIATKDCEGAGAAGGLGFAFLSYLGAKLESGIELVMKATELEEKIKSADIVVTGEGRLDSQTCMGKAPIGVAKLAKKHGKKVIAFSGCVSDDAGECNKHGIDAFFPILRNVSTLDEALNEENAYANLKATSEQTFRLIKAFMI